MREEDFKILKLMESALDTTQKFTFENGRVGLEDQIQIETGVFVRSHWKLKETEDELASLKSQIEYLKIEIATLRSYMSRDIESMADAAIAGLT